MNRRMTSINYVWRGNFLSLFYRFVCLRRIFCSFWFRKRVITCCFWTTFAKNIWKSKPMPFPTFAVSFVANIRWFGRLNYNRWWLVRSFNVYGFSWFLENFRWTISRSRTLRRSIGLLWCPICFLWWSIWYWWFLRRAVRRSWLFRRSISGSWTFLFSISFAWTFWSIWFLCSFSKKIS